VPVVVEEPPAYPQAITDRPITLYPGMSQFDFGFEFSKELSSTVDADGRTTTTVVGEQHPYSHFAYALGNVELDVGAGRIVTTGASIATRTFPAVVGLSFGFGAPQADGSLYFDQYASLSHKLVIDPGRVAVFGSVGAGLSEARWNRAGVLTDSHGVSLGATAIGELQLSERVGLYVGLEVNVPVSYSSSVETWTPVTIYATPLVAMGQWDASVTVGLTGANGEALPSFSIGAAKRWGR
jgi:hypothetical protein